jgi:hypothetical protein
MEMVDNLLKCPHKNPQGAYIAQNYASAERIVWTLMKHYLSNIPGIQFKEGKLTCVVPRGTDDIVTIFLLGAEKFDSIRGIYLDYAVLDEYAYIPRAAWEEVVLPALMDRKGGATIMTTPNGKNHAYELFNKATADTKSLWSSTRKTVYETGVFTPDEIEIFKDTLGDEAFEQEMLVSWTAQVKGAYYKEEFRRIHASKRITKVPYDPAVPVDVFFDLGIGDSTALWFIQQVGKEVHAISYLEASGKGLDWYAKYIKDKPFPVDTLILPHDANARELGTGLTRVETLRSLGFHKLQVVPRQNVDDGIHASRMLLERTWFDAEECALGIERLEGYRAEFVELKGVFRKTPVHDMCSHGADSWRTGAMGLVSQSKRDRFSTSRNSHLDFEYGPSSQGLNLEVISDYDIYDT